MVRREINGIDRPPDIFLPSPLGCSSSPPGTAEEGEEINVGEVREEEVGGSARPWESVITLRGKLRALNANANANRRS